MNTCMKISWINSMVRKTEYMQYLWEEERKLAPGKKKKDEHIPVRYSNPKLRNVGPKWKHREKFPLLFKKYYNESKYKEILDIQKKSVIV